MCERSLVGSCIYFIATLEELPLRDLSNDAGFLLSSARSY